MNLSHPAPCSGNQYHEPGKQQYHHGSDGCRHIRIRFLNSAFCQNRCDSRKKRRTYCIKYPHISHLPKTSSFYNTDKCIRFWIIHHVIHLFVAISQILEQASFLVTLPCALISLYLQKEATPLVLSPWNQAYHVLTDYSEHALM